MKTARQSAPAKVNLALDILGERPDGYHDMRMVMQTVSLCDTISLEETAGGFVLRAADITIPEGRKSLEQQAAEAFFKAVGKPMPGLAVTLDKRTPAYAGLGGGSADTAALLRILRDTYCPDMSLEELEAVGLEVGSDVPFCIRGGTALAEGRGEVLTDLPTMPECWVVICKPAFDLPTPQMFARFRPEHRKNPPDIDGMMAALKEGNLEGVARRVNNVFEAALSLQARVQIDDIKDTMLRCGAMTAAMSGSGPTVFGLFKEEEPARRMLKVLGRRRYAKAFLAKPVGRLA